MSKREKHLYVSNYHRIQEAKREDVLAGLDPYWEDDPCYNKWLEYINANDKAKVVMRNFLRWKASTDNKFSKDTPCELVSFQKQDLMSYELLDVVQGWVRQLTSTNGKSMAKSTKLSYYSTLRSFFEINRAPLPEDRFRQFVTSDLKLTRKRLTVDEFRNVLVVSKPVHRAIWMILFQSGMDITRFRRWNLRNDSLDRLLDHVEKKKFVMRIDFPNGRKKNKHPYFTYIADDSFSCIQEWLPERVEGKAVFNNRNGEPVKYSNLQQSWDTYCMRIGIRGPRKSKQRYGKNIHELRSLFKSRWRRSGTNIVGADFMMGHTVDPNNYDRAMNQPNYAYSLYVQAKPWLNLLSEKPDYLSHTEQAAIETLLKEQNQRIQRLEKLVELLTNYKEKP
ncbi:MAG: hypothetical protein ACTSX1_15780 [Candidatus Heimdallarchaeaceae archaeon]